jgi:hypothetical protein
VVYFADFVLVGFVLGELKWTNNAKEEGEFEWIMYQTKTKEQRLLEKIRADTEKIVKVVPDDGWLFTLVAEAHCGRLVESPTLAKERTAAKMWELAGILQRNRNDISSILKGMEIPSIARRPEPPVYCHVLKLIEVSCKENTSGSPYRLRVQRVPPRGAGSVGGGAEISLTIGRRLLQMDIYLCL